MIKEIRNVDKNKQIVRITTADERWYAIPDSDMGTGLPVYKYLPSATWVAGYYPKGIGFYKWLASKGWDEAQAIKEEAGARGSRVHQAIDYLEQTGELPIDKDMDGHQLTVDELEALLSFSRWYNEVRPDVLASEMTVTGDNYAGTLDRIYRIDGTVYIVDFKTSQYLWESMKLQISSYSHAHIDIKKLGISDEEWSNRKLAVLQVGYRKNRARYKFTEIDDKFDLFKVAQLIWENENPNTKVMERDFPLIIKINKEKENGKS